MYNLFNKFLSDISGLLLHTCVQLIQLYKLVETTQSFLQCSCRVSKAQSTFGWETPALQNQLGEDHPGSMGVRSYRVLFSQQPYQPYPPRALTHPQAEEVLAHAAGDWEYAKSMQ